MMTKTKATFQRVGGGYGFPETKVTYVFLDENKQRIEFLMRHFMSGTAPDTGTEGTLTYDGDCLISFEYEGGCLENKKA